LRHTSPASEVPVTDLQEFVQDPLEDFDALIHPPDSGEGADADARSAPRRASPLRWKSKGSRTRRSFTIHGIIGANGHGKSLCLMHDTKLSMDKGRPIPRSPGTRLAGIRLMTVTNLSPGGNN
jgi:hypothetical protein